MYELNGEEVTLEFLQGKAQEYDMDFDSYLETMKKRGLIEKTDPLFGVALKKYGVVEKKEDVAEPGAAVASETTAPDASVSSSEDTSLELQDINLDPTKFQATRVHNIIYLDLKDL